MKLFSKVLKSVVNFNHYSYKTEELERDTMDVISIVILIASFFFFLGEENRK